MNELITVSSNLEAFYAFLKWLSGGLGFFGLGWLLLGFARYIISAGDAEKKKESIHTLIYSAIVLVVSAVIGGMVFWLEHL